MVRIVHKRNPNAFRPQRGMTAEEAKRAKIGQAVIAGRGPTPAFSNRPKFAGSQSGHMQPSADRTPSEHSS